MDRRVTLLRGLCGTFARGVVKIETEQCGFAYLDALLADGVCLEYGELTPLRLVHRYKLSHVSDVRLGELLAAHVGGGGNVCRYFDDARNDAFCFNVDNNLRTNRESAAPAVDVAVHALRRTLRELGCEPLIVASGRGYHAWCRLTAPVANARLHGFMVAAGARALRAVEIAGYPHTYVKVNLYPHLRLLQNVVSLRLFGARHTKTGTFSHVFETQGFLDEAASWDRFESFVTTPATPAAEFEATCERIERLGPMG